MQQLILWIGNTTKWVIEPYYILLFYTTAHFNEEVNDTELNSKMEVCLDAYLV